MKFSLYSKRQTSARAGNHGFTEKILRQVHVHGDLLAEVCSWWHMRMVMVKVISGEKWKKTKKKRGEETERANCNSGQLEKIAFRKSQTDPSLCVLSRATGAAHCLAIKLPECTYCFPKCKLRATRKG